MSRILDLLNGLQADSTDAAKEPAGAPGRPARQTDGISKSPSPTKHYGLRESPFSDSLNPAYYFQTSAQQRVAIRLLDTVRESIALALVTGPAGSGKTMLSQLLLHELDTEKYAAVLVLVTPKMTKTGLLREILRESGREDIPARTKDLVDTLHQHVMDLHSAGRRLVILIDEAHFLSPDALHILRTISNLETPRQKLCSTLLFAEEHFLRRLGHPSYRSLATRMYHRLRLEPLSEEETDQYITYRLMVAGGTGELFTADARRAIHLRANGICREVNRLCHLALLEGAMSNMTAIGPSVVEGL